MIFGGLSEEVGFGDRGVGLRQSLEPNTHSAIFPPFWNDKYILCHYMLELYDLFFILILQRV